MPVRYGRNNANPRWKPISHYDIKELRKAIKDSGLSSSYFNNVMRSIFDSYHLTPSDFRNILSMVFKIHSIFCSTYNGKSILTDWFRGVLEVLMLNLGIVN